MCLCFFQVLVQLKYSSVVCKNNDDEQPRSFETSAETGVPASAFTDTTRNLRGDV